MINEKIGNKWSELLNVDFPACGMCGQCCICVTPSTPTKELIKKAEAGDQFAIDFLSIFVPFESIEEAKKVNINNVERSLAICEKPNSKVKKEELVFYRCKHLLDNNLCSNHENRPELCRSFPDSPFLVVPKGCVYENWVAECREKYKALKEELNKLNEYKAELANLKYQQRCINLNMQLKRLESKNRSMFVLSRFALTSSVNSWIK